MKNSDKIKTKNAKKKWYRFLFIFICLTFVSGYFANRYIKKKGFSNLWDFITNYTANSSKAANANYETVNIKIGKKEFTKLELLRNKHLKRGLIENGDDDFVDAKLFYKGKKIDAKIRLKGHMTDHLQNKKWSFRVKTKGNDAFMGMTIFSLQHPGTRNYIYEWIYHEMLKQEGVIALTYDFIRVKVNDEDWGIYALEENFGQELLKHNKRPKGPIVRFSPDLYWVYRKNEFNKIIIDEQYGVFQSSFPESYDQKTVFSDSSMISSYKSTVSILEKVKRREIKVSQVFDLKKLAIFHAIVDLVGGHHSIDWSDVKYFYNNETRLIEPVAYESFSINSTWQLAGAGRCKPTDSSFTNDWHSFLFSDTAFFAQYLIALNKISNKNWLNLFFKTHKTQLDNKLATLYNEFAYKKLSLNQYYANQKNIKALLSCPGGILAFYNDKTSTELSLNIANADVLPLIISKLIIDSSEFVVNNIFVDAKAIDNNVKYQKIKLTVPEKLKIKSNSKIAIEYHLPGLNYTRTSTVVNASADSSFNPLPENNFLKFDCFTLQGKTIFVKPGNYVFNESIHVPDGYTLIGSNFSFEFNNHSILYSESPVIFAGQDVNTIQITSRDKTGQGILLKNINSKCRFNNILFSNLMAKNYGAITIVNCSNVLIENCSFSGLNSQAVHLFSGSLSIEKCYFGAINNHAIKEIYSNLILSNSEFNEIKGNAISLQGSNGTFNKLLFSKIKNTAVKISEASTVVLRNSKIEKAKVAAEAIDNSSINIFNTSIKNCDVGFKAEKKSDVFGPSKINVSGSVLENVKLKFKIDKKSKVNIK